MALILARGVPLSLLLLDCNMNQQLIHSLLRMLCSIFRVLTPIVQVCCQSRVCGSNLMPLFPRAQRV
eukprot:6199831-Pleurochrysis_carterae.AAC.2